MLRELDTITLTDLMRGRRLPPKAPDQGRPIRQLIAPRALGAAHIFILVEAP